MGCSPALVSSVTATNNANPADLHAQARRLNSLCKLCLGTLTNSEKVQQSITG